MATGEARFDDQIQLDGMEEARLKYLEFVHAAAIHAIVCFSTLYVYAKDKAGPLKPGVEAVESTVKTVVGPVYDKYRDVPIGVLNFVDRKGLLVVVMPILGWIVSNRYALGFWSISVDESVSKLDTCVPPVVKQVSSKAYTAAQKAPEVARSVATGVQRTGMVDIASGIAKNVYAKYETSATELYSKYEPLAELYAVSAWRSLNKLPLFPQVALVMVPTAAFCSEKYNQTVISTAEKGYKVAGFFPLVPTEKISKVFNSSGVEFQPLDARH
ncbi:Stress-related protein [Drosera capensis]